MSGVKPIFCEIAKVHSKTQHLYFSKENNPYLRAVRDIGDVLVRRLENPLLQVEFLFNLSPSGRKFNKAVKIAHNITNKVHL